MGRLTRYGCSWVWRPTSTAWAEYPIQPRTAFWLTSNQELELVFEEVSGRGPRVKVRVMKVIHSSYPFQKRPRNRRIQQMKRKIILALALVLSGEPLSMILAAPCIRLSGRAFAGENVSVGDIRITFATLFVASGLNTRSAGALIAWLWRRNHGAFTNIVAGHNCCAECYVVRCAVCQE